jgi:hypothetical protein
MTTFEIITTVSAAVALISVIGNIIMAILSLRLNRKSWELNHEARSYRFKQFIYEKQYDAYLAAIDWMHQMESKYLQIDANDKERLEQFEFESLQKMEIWMVTFPNDVIDALLTWACCLEKARSGRDGQTFLSGKRYEFAETVRIHLGIDPIMDDVSEMLKTAYRQNEIIRERKRQEQRERIKATLERIESKRKQPVLAQS